jgi:alpha-beta hydrolase superfamily lysophospholipase
MAMGIPDSTLEVIKGAGHMALFEKPELVNAAIQDFLNGVYPAGNVDGSRPTNRKEMV